MPSNIYQTNKTNGEVTFRIDKAYKGDRYVKVHTSLPDAEADLARVMENWAKGLTSEGKPWSQIKADTNTIGIKSVIENARRILAEHGAKKLIITETGYSFEE